MITLCKKLQGNTNIYSGEAKVDIKLNSRLTTKYVALIAIFSALYAMLRYLPLGPMIGLAGTFSFSDALAPLIGIILGPFAGGISVIIGTFTAIALGKPVVFFGLDFLPAFINCIAMGFLIKRKWAPIIALYAILLGIFIASPYSSALIPVGSLAIPFTWLHIVAFILFLTPLRSKAVNNIKKFNTTNTTIEHLQSNWGIINRFIKRFNIPNMAWSLALLAFVGTMLQHITGSLLTQLTLGVFAEGTDFTALWTAIFYVYPFERILMVLIAVGIGVPLIIAVKRSMLPFETPINEEEKKTTANSSLKENLSAKLS